MPNKIKNLSAINIAGKNAQTFLQGQLTCDMQSLTQHGDAQLAACCDHRGRMLANFWVARWHDHYRLILPTTMQATVIEHLHKYAIFSKVTVTADPNQLQFFSLQTGERPTPTEESIYIALPDKPRLLCVTAQTPKASYQNNEKEWALDNINAGLALIVPATSLKFTPQMLNLAKLGGVSFTKGCYVGQEIVARTEHLGTLKRHLHQISLSTNHPAHVGDPLQTSNNTTAGIIVAAVADHTATKILAVIEDRYQSEFM